MKNLPTFLFAATFFNKVNKLPVCIPDYSFNPLPSYRNGKFYDEWNNEVGKGDLITFTDDSGVPHIKRIVDIGPPLSFDLGPMMMFEGFDRWYPFMEPMFYKFYKVRRD